MKLILFMYFSAVYSHPPKKYTTELHVNALRIVLAQWGLLAMFIMQSVFIKCGLWDWFVQNWPYDYGRTHSKNWTTPSAVFAIVFSVVFYKLLQFYFSREAVQREIIISFDNGFGRKLSEQTSWLAVFHIFFNAFAGVMFAAGNYKIFICCLLVWVGAELWIRRKFYRPQIDGGIKEINCNKSQSVVNRKQKNKSN